jgi:hypothetical protein
MFVDLFEEGTLDVQVFDDCFDDQIAVFDLRQVVVKVTGRNARRKLGNKERRRLGFCCSFETLARNKVAILQFA